tara:strand:- start:1462 stop:2985 length:1524 start_codon:yes stop_codon:yes gene_type:complete
MDTDNLIMIERHDNNFFKIYCNEEQSMELYSYFECYTKDYRFNPKFKAKIWNGKISFFNRYDSTLPIGLIYKLPEFIKRYGYKLFLNFDTKSFFNDIKIGDMDNFYKKIFKDSVYYPRDYQNESIHAAISKKRGVLEVATGGGKSLIIYSLIRFIMTQGTGKILLVVPNVGLTIQMFNDFVEYGWSKANDEISVLYHDSGRYDKNKRILISTWQSIYKRPEGFFRDFDGVLVDETHGAASDSLQKILKKAKNAEYRIGLTGTLPDEIVDIHNIYGYIGPKLIQVSTDRLIKEGYLSKIKIANLLIQYPKEIVKKYKNCKYDEEVRFITTHPERNKVFDYIINNINTTDNVLVLCTKVDHVKSIYDYISKLVDGTKRKVFLIHGKIDVEKREKIRQFTEKNDGVIIVGTYGTISMGVNIKKLHHVISASSYKKKLKFLQAIGRGLRLHDSKEQMIWWDIVDDMRWEKRKGSIQKFGYNHTFTHFQQRLKQYDKQNFKYINKKVDLSEL